MSIILINVLGFVTCASVVGLYSVDMLRKSKIEAVTETYNDVLPEYDLQTEAAGLAVQVVGYGVDRIEDLTDKSFNSKTFYKFKHLLKKYQIKPDGDYFEYPAEKWDGYGDESPDNVLGKYDMDV